MLSAGLFGVRLFVGFCCLFVCLLFGFFVNMVILLLQTPHTCVMCPFVFSSLFKCCAMPLGVERHQQAAPLCRKKGLFLPSCSNSACSSRAGSLKICRGSWKQPRRWDLFNLENLKNNWEVQRSEIQASGMRERRAS